MKILSLQVGGAKPIEARGKTWSTGIYKDQVAGPLFLSKLGLPGDVQANPSFHGGEARALYIFSKKAYEYWTPHVKNQSILTNGAFGENVTIEDLNEDEIDVNDIFTLGETVIQATMPRFPCLLLAAKFENPDSQKLLRASRKPGVLFRVLKTGHIKVGDELQLKQKSNSGLKILEFLDMTDNESITVENFERTKRIPGMPEMTIQRIAMMLPKAPTH
jgi:MOSC domain-containing protein YiiM